MDQIIAAGAIERSTRNLIATEPSITFMVHEVVFHAKKNSTGSRTRQVKNKESYNSLVKDHLSVSVGRHHPMIRRQATVISLAQSWHCDSPNDIECFFAGQLFVNDVANYRNDVVQGALLPDV